PLVFYVAPGLSDVRLFGVPLPWLLLGIAVYPFLLLLGWRYVRRAERIERDFADLMSEAER
ncbi:MAG: rane protein, partial [Nocardioides sp.]|nr:rane protein [Nocardioides sp.]